MHGRTASFEDRVEMHIPMVKVSVVVRVGGAISSGTSPIIGAKRFRRFEAHESIRKAHGPVIMHDNGWRGKGRGGGETYLGQDQYSSADCRSLHKTLIHTRV